MNKNNGCGTYLIIVIITFFLFCVIKTCLEPSASEQWYQDHKEEIDRYNYNHKDDWNGYKGTRRNSWAEDNELKSDGYEPDEYRKQHGY